LSLSNGFELKTVYKSKARRYNYIYRK